MRVQHSSRLLVGNALSFSLSLSVSPPHGPRSSGHGRRMLSGATQAYRGGEASGGKQVTPPRHGEALGDLAAVASVGAALFASRPSKVPFIENNISLIEFAREKVA